MSAPRGRALELSVGDHNNDALGIVAMLGMFLGMLLLFGIVGFCVRRAYNRRKQAIELRAPLLESTEHRLDAALRNAEEGFTRCPDCAFENFKQSAFCGLCGSKIGVDASEDDKHAGPRSARKKAALVMQKLRMSVAHRRKDSRSQLEIFTPAADFPPPLVDEEDEEQQQLRASRRQLRARRRKEWTRKLDVEGNPFWFRDGCLGAADMRFPGFAVKFQAAESSGEEDSASVAEEVDVPRATESVDDSSERSHGSNVVISVGHDEEEEEDVDAHDAGGDGDESNGRQLERQQSSPQPTIDTLERQVKRLEHQAATLPLQLVDANDADPSELPVHIEEGKVQAMKEVAAMAAKDFPTKYAHFVTTATALMTPPTREHLRLNLERDSLYEDSLESLAVIPLRNVRSVLRINFLDEAGVDAGGVHREWFIMLTEMLADPQRGLFVCVDKSEQTYHLNPNSARDAGEKHLLYLYAVGRIIGRALLEGSVMGMHLCPALLKLMLGLPLSFSDMEDFDPEMYRSMQWLLENDDVDALGLDFTVTVEAGDGTHQVVELVPNGSAIAVTDVNKQSFVDLKWKFLLVERVSGQLQALLRGFYEVVPADLLMLLDASELDFLLCGSDEIDVDDWEKHTRYTEELHDHRARIWFWEIVREMPNEYRRRLLLFSTGSSRVPLAGFAALTSYDGKLCPFTLKGVRLVGDGFIHSHACFNRLDLPLHVVREELVAVMAATLETEQYGFTTD